MTEFDRLLDLLADRVFARLEPRLQGIEAQLDALREQLPPALVDVREAAARLGVSIPTIRRMVRRGELPSRRVGRSLRIDLSKVRAAGHADVAALAGRARAERSVRLVRTPRTD